MIRPVLVHSSNRLPSGVTMFHPGVKPTRITSLGLGPLRSLTAQFQFRGTGSARTPPEELVKIASTVSPLLRG